MNKLEELKQQKYEIEKEIKELEEYEKHKRSANYLIGCMPNTPNLKTSEIKYINISIDSYESHYGTIRTEYTRDVANIVEDAINQLKCLLYDK